VNEACYWLVAGAFETGTIRQFDPHELCHRQHFELTAQVAIGRTAKVADADRAGAKGAQHRFHKRSAQRYDDPIVTFRANDIVSIWTREGRFKIKSVMAKRQHDLLAHRKGDKTSDCRRAALQRERLSPPDSDDAASAPPPANSEKRSRAAGRIADVSGRSAPRVYSLG
jgi:hypothetical protein